MGVGWRSASRGWQNQGKHFIVFAFIEIFAQTGNQQENRNLLKTFHLNGPCWQCYVLAWAYRRGFEHEGNCRKKHSRGSWQLSKSQIPRLTLLNVQLLKPSQKPYMCLGAACWHWHHICHCVDSFLIRCLLFYILDWNKCPYKDKNIWQFVFVSLVCSDIPVLLGHLVPTRIWKHTHTHIHTVLKRWSGASLHSSCSLPACEKRVERTKNPLFCCL